MRARTRVAGGLAVIGGVVLLRPGTRLNKAMRHQVDVLGRRLRMFGGAFRGVSYRMRGRRPDPDVAGAVLADRIRSTLGPLEKCLDLPHVHVMVEDHVVLLHGVVGNEHEADEIEAAAGAVSGVLGVESYLHVGLTGSDTRPSEGRRIEHPSDAQRHLLDAPAAAGLDPSVAMAAVRAILATFAERLPAGERDQVATHLPADVSAMFAAPRRARQAAPPRTVPDLVARIAATAAELPHDKARAVTAAVLGELRSLVPEEAADVGAVLPAELREFWKQASA